MTTDNNPSNCVNNSPISIKPSMDRLPKCSITDFYYLLRLFISELIGTGTLCFVAVLYSFPPTTNPVSDCIIVFFTFSWIVWIFGPISGAQINPIVTIAFFITRKITIIHTILFIISQLVGAILGAFIARSLLPNDLTQLNKIGLVMKNPLISQGNAVGFELFGGFAIVLAILATTDEFRPNIWTAGLFTSLPFQMGVVHALLVGILARYSGAGLNPARCLGTAVVANDFTDLWVYLVGPLCGSLIAVILYEVVLSHGVSLHRLKAWLTNPNFDRNVDYTSRNEVFSVSSIKIKFKIFFFNTRNIHCV
ncbi:unnamed protein product [Schistosoma margrebowiei]|uniref:Uncharacterized protein n=1 Tax=Schistosoma margrebowiei TaxID=48269 RepID=A0A183MQI0_9TREM|nr:unnamed protein product [Schistosoma margrebowiei]